MPVRNFNSMSLRIPRRLGLDLHNNGMIKDEEIMKQFLPYVDIRTGLQGRLIVRDPIAGLGDLPSESDPLKGNRLRSQTQGQRESQTPRNPILLEGDLGEEYNCLYTTKPLSCKPRNVRDIITLKGDLGEELDPLHPDGSKYRRSFRRSVQRDPISGVGDFGPREWDPIWKEHGKLRLTRPEQTKRDPITHTVPLENMGEKLEKNLVRHYPEKISKEDPINHTLDGEPITQSPKFSLRMFREKKISSDPICHTISAARGYDHNDSSDFPHGGRSHNYHYDNNKRRNPITHETFEDPHPKVTNPTNQSYILGELINGHNYASNSMERRDTTQLKPRNPILGEGIDSRDYVDLMTIQGGGSYAFRNLSAAPPPKSDKAASRKASSTKSETSIKKLVKATTPVSPTTNNKK